ncbi:hypothetical protein JMK10_16835 [Rhodovulum sulfidophilum]|uniref:hypothetical protein n=1 Tax=Rhodovulum sulfidophilum TaxID=35806 RepID=UPI001922BE6F|nr:hypothetical protein [Rhodovulum sulfidophilum]MBL3573895.1 hypothetical protein [Rhodovulum sulfidophilum]MCE8430029.1 hypothetical protein [Rhodovulum sulfidophilum]MCF4118428.1 hypothetical protein [Rhodovulum sulfidophilum]
MAYDTDPALTTVGIDLDISSGELDFRVNDVPVFDPQSPLKTDARITTQLSLNEAFSRGQNTINLAFRPLSSDGLAPGLHTRFRFWEAGSPPAVFEGDGYALDISLAPSPANPDQMSLIASPSKDQPLIMFSKPVRIAAVGDADGWATWQIQADVRLDLPQEAWRGGQRLQASGALRQELVREYRELHAELASGEETARDALRPFLHRLAQSIGASDEEYYDAGYRQLLSGEASFSLQAFDVAETEVELFGEGKLAALLPIPITFENSETSQRAKLFVYFWKDQDGTWQLIH